MSAVVIERVQLLFAVLLECFARSEPEEDGTIYENDNFVELPWMCGFGESREMPDWCFIEQYGLDHGDWVPWSGISPNPHTGPPEDGTGRYGTSIVIPLCTH